MFRSELAMPGSPPVNSFTRAAQRQRLLHLGQLRFAEAPPGGLVVGAHLLRLGGAGDHRCHRPLREQPGEGELIAFAEAPGHTILEL
jgi:hypothetical protein